MPEPARPYPGMPTYGAPQSATPRTTAPTPAPHGAWLSGGLSVLFNLVTLVGVVEFGWPPGNVFLLFWVENVVLGLCTLVRVMSARGTAPAGRSGEIQVYFGDAPASGVQAPAGRGLTGLFFVFHYGIFCLVHLAFTVFVAARLGVEVSWLFLGLPVVLLLIRYGVEVATTWFGADGLRDTTSPRAAMVQPYPRIVVLQLGVMFAFAIVLVGFVGSVPGPSPLGHLGEVVTSALAYLPVGWRGPGVVAVGVLLIIKTVVDVITTRRVLRVR